MTANLILLNLFVGLFLFIVDVDGKFYNNQPIVLQVNSLKCERLVDPRGIDVQSPRLSWHIEANVRDQSQVFFQILAATSLENLNQDKADLWNSGKVSSGDNVNVRYAGKELTSGMQCFWKVKVWNTEGVASDWSSPAFFSVGLLHSTDWKAKWIGYEKTSEKDVVNEKFTRLSARMFRKEFDVTRTVKRATAYICGLGLFELYINGEKIGDQVLAPALSQYEKRSYYVTFDVSQNVRQGKNALGTILGNGRFFWVRGNTNVTNYGFPKMIAQVEIEYTDGTFERVVTDESWKVTTDGPILTNNEWDGEEYDATKEMPGWDNAGFDDSKWQPVDLVVSPSASLNAQMLNPIKIKEVLKPISVKEIKPGTFIYDMGQNMVGWASLKVSGRRGDKVTMRFSELIKEDGSLYLDNIRSAKVTDMYTLKGTGEEHWEPKFVYHGFRYVEVTGFPGTPDLSSITGKVIYDDIFTTGSFETSNEIINQIYRNAYWGIRGNYRSMPTDCPQRDERMGWLGDRSSGSKGESYMFDHSALYAKWLQDIEDAQTVEGSIPDVAPTYWKVYKDNVTWPASYIIIARMLYDQFADLEPVRKHYNSMKKWIFYMQGKFMEDGIMPRDTYGDWCVPPESQNLIHSQDHTRKTSPEILGSFFFYHLVQLMEQNAVLLGKVDDAKTFAGMAADLKLAVQDKLYDPVRKQYSSTTATANIYALAFDIAPADARKDIFAAIEASLEGDYNSHISTGLVGGMYLMRILTEHGRADLACKIATNTTYPSWGYMVKNGATTIWELWNGNTADPAMNSANHVMLLGDLIIWYFEHLAGIKPDNSQPGFKHIVMKPSVVKGLSFVKASHNTPNGLVASAWKADAGKFTWDITIPANSRATVYIPTKKVEEIKEGEAMASSAQGVKFVRTEDDYAIFEIGSGKYQFVSSYEPKDEAMKMVASPTITPRDTAFAVSGKVVVSVSCPENDARITYTTDGSVPTEKSKAFKAPFVTDKSMMIQARAFKNGYRPSNVKARFINVYQPDVNGWNYTYYEGEWKNMPDFSKLTPVKTGRINTLDIEFVKMKEDYWGIVFETTIDIKTDDLYTFFICSDDGSIFKIDDKTLILNDGAHLTTERSGKIALKAGRHKLRIEYFDGRRGQYLNLYYKTASMPKQPVPSSVLFFNR